MPAIQREAQTGNERCETGYNDRAGQYMGQRGVTLPRL